MSAQYTILPQYMLISHPIKASLLLLKELVLRLLEQLGAPGYGQDDGLRHAVVVQTHLHRRLKVGHQQGLGHQPLTV